MTQVPSAQVRARRRSPLSLGLTTVALTLSGCVFFDAEHVVCLDDGTCDPDGDGDGDLASGGDGSGSGGNTYPITGGRDSSDGGDSSGGGDGDGGDEGSGGGGTGGDGSGGLGTGGEGSGGDGSGGTGGVSQEILELRRDLKISEVHSSGFAELYNDRDVAIDLTGLFIIVINPEGGPEYDYCDLDGATVASGDVIVAQTGSAGCSPGISNCVQACNLPIEPGCTIALFKGDTDVESSDEIDRVDFPSMGAPNGTESLQLCSDDNFKKVYATLGEVNTCN